MCIRDSVTLLLSPGREAHSFEPTPLDAVTISEADVFLYNGGEGEYLSLIHISKELTESRRLRDQYGFEQNLLSLVENERQ